MLSNWSETYFDKFYKKFKKLRLHDSTDTNRWPLAGVMWTRSCRASGTSGRSSQSQKIRSKSDTRNKRTRKPETWTIYCCYYYLFYCYYLELIQETSKQEVLKIGNRVVSFIIMVTETEKDKLNAHWKLFVTSADLQSGISI